MQTETLMSHFGNWVGFGIWVLMYAAALVFIPFYKKSQRKPATAYLAFVVAYAYEMFGIPLSMYLIAAVFGSSLPEGILWGHTLNAYIGYWGMYLCIGLSLIGLALIFTGWKAIYHNYWSKPAGEGRLVTHGIYRYIRHPQYTGFLLITLGMICEWATLPTLIFFPIIVIIYVRLAKKEEVDMLHEFGPDYEAYRRSTGMFLPRLNAAHRLQTAPDSRS